MTMFYMFFSCSAIVLKAFVSAGILAGFNSIPYFVSVFDVLDGVRCSREYLLGRNSWNTAVLSSLTAFFFLNAWDASYESGSHMTVLATV